MRLNALLLLPLALLSLRLQCVKAARILAIISVPSYSHQVAYRPIWQLLGERGHEVVVLTTNPIANLKTMSYKEINLQFLYQALQQDFLTLRYNSSWLDIMRESLWNSGYLMAQLVFEDENVRKLYEPNSGEKFDLVMVEILLTPALYALGHRFKAPIIGMSTLPIFNHHYYIQGAPVLPSHPASWEMEKNAGFNLSFWKRMTNFITMWSFVYRAFNEYTQRHHDLARKYLGEDVPDLWELESNMSLILMYQRDLISFVRPSLPKIIPVGGIHMSKDLPPLPKASQLSRSSSSYPIISLSSFQNMQDFLSDAPDGFIYVSLGTNVKTTSITDKLPQMFYRALSKLPCKVLWKFEGVIPNKSANIYASRWFPQQSVLSHPKIRAFVYQGGLQSTEEAVAAGVPLVGLPVLADQDTQVSKMVSLGVARQLELMELTAEDIEEAIRDVLTDKRYKEKMMMLKELSMDQPFDRLNHTVWWIEFVIRHGGAPHLQCSIAQEPWYQRNDMDIIAFFSVSIFAIVLSALIAACKCFVCLSGRHKSLPSKGKEKIG